MTTWRLRLARSGATDDIVLQAEDASTVDDVIESLVGAGLPVDRLAVNGLSADGRRTLGELGLTHGDTIGLPTGPPSRDSRQPGTYLVAVSGPEAGRWALLTPGGQLTVGRAADSRFRLNDPLVSAAHVSVRSDGTGGVMLEDLHSSNGTYLENVQLTGPTPIVPGQYAQVGATVLTVVQVRDGDLHVLSPARQGATAFQRQFRPALPPLSEPYEAPEAPTRPEEERGRMWLQLLVPVATGAGFVIYSGKYIYLLFLLVAPLLMFGYQLYRRRREAAKFRAREDEYATALARQQAEESEIHAAEQQRRRRSAVVGGEAILLAQLAHHRLWEREPTDPDYLEVCIGLADQTSAVRHSKSGDVENPKLWGLPLGASVRETGSLLVSGELSRARAVGRSVLLNLAATHSPNDVAISVVTEESRGVDWNWVRWLPHAYSGPSTSGIYSTPDQRDAFVGSLEQIIDTWEGPAPASAHVVMVDRAQIVDGSKLTTVLRRGPSAGIYTVVLDDRITPEGVRGTLRLGANPDEGVYASSVLAETSGILTAELAPTWAEMAALSMAGLRPASAQDRSETQAEVHLVDLLGSGGLTAESVRQRWQSSPRENVVVGLAGRTPVAIDFVRHGPHAIVGGATRSGKTEFLLSWLTALCLHNSPDDLAILVADFKGGVDHVQTARLPHVISLSTNKDIRAFERTLVMLEAEIKRREDVFASVGTSNIEAYRVARKRDGSVLAVPRLLVVVDEFSELRQTDREGGGGYMGRLESVARVGAGLGIHLVLVTQNFADGQLPAQIESQIGLGVCFRVEEGAHSRVVLRSPVAADIPADRPGRGWARLRGLSLQQFQSARVAGRRRDIAAPGAGVVVEPVPFTMVSSAAPDTASGAVPHDETDLVTFLAAMNEAARGWRPPLPWPDELDPRTRLADVIAANRGGPGAPIGICDVPDRQSQRIAVLDSKDDQVLLLGSMGAVVGETLLTMATAEALTAGPDDFHMYGIDLEANWLQSLAALPNTAAVACLNDEMSDRIIRRLRGEAERRRALFDQLGVPDLEAYHRVAGQRLPRVRLYVNGADRLIGTGAGDPSVLWRPLAGLVADSPGTGIDIVLAGSPSLAGRTITQRATRRIVLSAADTSIYRSLGVPRMAEVDLDIPFRGYDVTNRAILQFGRLSTGEHGASDVVESLGAALRKDVRGAEVRRGPESLPEVRWPLLWSRLNLDSLVVPAGYGAALPVGVDSDTGRWLWMDVEEEGPLLAIGGAGRSGRTATLVALGELARGLGWAVQVVAPGRRSLLRASDHPRVETLVDLEPATRRRTLYLVDDANRLDPADELKSALTESTKPFLVAMAGPPGMFGGSRSGVLRGIPELQVAITLAPTATRAIGDSIVPDHLRADPRPGRGLFWRSSESGPIHLPWHPSAEVSE